MPTTFSTRLINSPQLYAMIGATMLPIHLWAARPLFAWQDRLLAWFLLVTFLFTAYRFICAGAQTVPIIPMVSGQLYVLYGLATFSQDHLVLVGGPFVPSGAAITIALGLVAAGQILLLWMAHLGSSFRSATRMQYGAYFPAPQPIAWKRMVTGVALLTIGNHFVQNLSGEMIPVLVRNIVLTVLNPYVILAVVLYLGYFFNDAKLKRTGHVIVLALSGVGLLSSMLETVIVPFYLLMVGAWIWGKQFSFRLVMVLVVLFFGLNPVKHQFRLLLADAPPVESIEDISYRISLWGESFRRAWDDPFSRQENVEVAAARTSALLNLAQAVDWVPSMVPYKHGDGFSTALFYFVPRVLWPNKPGYSDLQNNRWALTFGKTTLDGIKKSSFGLLQPIDGYWDFGVPGAVLYLGAYGFLLGFLFRPMKAAEDIEVLLGLAFSGTFFQMMMNLQQVMAALFSLFAGAWILLKIINALSPVGSTKSDGISRTPRAKEPTT